VTTTRHETPAQPSVEDNRAASRLELTIEGQTAFLAYERNPQTFVIVHTEAPPALRGRHLGDVLVKAAIARARAERLRLVAVCPFARAYLRRHPDLDAG
jgi:predicted GNAT family acetyltransferase